MAGILTPFTETSRRDDHGGGQTAIVSGENAECQGNALQKRRTRYKQCDGLPALCSILRHWVRPKRSYNDLFASSLMTDFRTCR
jgi:hypothetical protein